MRFLEEGAVGRVCGKGFCCGNELQDVLVCPVAAVGIEKTAAVAVCFQVKPERPHAPEKVNVPVSHAPAAKIHEAGKRPVVQNDVGKAVVSVQQNPALQRGCPLRQQGFGLRCREAGKAVGKGKGAKLSRMGVGLRGRKVVCRSVCNGTA